MVVYAIIGSKKIQHQFNLTYPVLRRCYDGPVTVISDLTADWQHDGYTRIDYKHQFSGFGVKTVLPHYVDAPKALFLDADILPLRPFDEIWRLLDSAEFCIARDTYPTVGVAVISDVKYQKWPPDELDLTIRALGFDKPYYNTGVFAWRAGKKSKDLFHVWNCEWLKHGNSSQYAFLRAVQYNNSPVRELSRQYNTYIGSCKSLVAARESGVVFLHYWAQHPSLASDATILMNSKTHL